MDVLGRLLRMFLTVGQRSDCVGAPAFLDSLPRAKHLPADRGCDADWHREALEDKGIKPFILYWRGRRILILRDQIRYRKRHGTENSFTRPKDWRRILTGYDRRPKVFLSARALDAVVMFRVWSLVRDTPLFNFRRWI